MAPANLRSSSPGHCPRENDPRQLDGPQAWGRSSAGSPLRNHDSRFA